MTTPHSRDNLNWDDERVIGYDHETLFLDELDKASGGSSLSVRVLTPNDWVMQIIYDCSCDNIITVENVKRMAYLESLVLQLPNWPKLCLATSHSDTGCSSSSYTSLASLISNPHTLTEAVLNVTLATITQEPIYTAVKSLFGKEFSASSQKSSITRAIFQTGGPLEIDGKRYTTMDDRRTEQENYIIEFGNQVQSILSNNP